jgi:FixJ family two-component response regulator
MNGERPIVFVVDDDRSVRIGLDRLLKFNGYRVDSFASAEEFLQVKSIPPVACLVLDVNLPGLNGMDVQVLLSRQGSLLPIIFITGHGDIPTAVHAVKSGAVSFLTKPFRESELLTEIESSFTLCRNEFQQRSEIADIHRRYATLTKRETEIFSFVVTGRLNKQTASELGIVENTVKVHRRRVMRKMHAESVAGLVLMSEKLKLPSSQPRPLEARI